MMKSSVMLNIATKLAIIGFLGISSCSQPSATTNHIHKFFLTSQLDAYVIAPAPISQSLDDAKKELSRISSLSPGIDKPYFYVSYEDAPQLSLAHFHRLVIGPMRKKDARKICKAYLNLDGDEGYTDEEETQLCRLAKARDFLTNPDTFESSEGPLGLETVIFKDVSIRYEDLTSAPVANTADLGASQKPATSTSPAPRSTDTAKIPTQKNKTISDIKTITIAGRNYTFPISAHVFAKVNVGNAKSIFCSDKDSDYFHLFKRSDMVESCDIRFTDAYTRCLGLPAKDTSGRRWKSDTIDTMDEALANVTMISECVLIQNLPNQFKLPDQKRDVPVDEVVAHIHSETPTLFNKLD